MQNLSALHLPSTRPRSTRYTGIAFAALINGVAIWAIMHGLTFHPSPPPPPTTTISIVKPDVPPTPPMKQPPVKLVTPTVLATPTVPPPVIPIEQPSDHTTITVTTQTQPPQTPAVPDSGPSGVMDTHSTPPYPPDARNLSQQGTVTLTLSIDATGAVTNAQVKTSSGYPELDQTAVNWVIAHWRYKPAIRNGAPVPSAALAAVKFDLRQAR